MAGNNGFLNSFMALLRWFFLKTGTNRWGIARDFHSFVPIFSFSFTKFGECSPKFGSREEIHIDFPFRNLESRLRQYSFHLLFHDEPCSTLFHLVPSRRSLRALEIARRDSNPPSKTVRAVSSVFVKPLSRFGIVLRFTKR